MARPRTTLKHEGNQSGSDMQMDSEEEDEDEEQIDIEEEDEVDDIDIDDGAEDAEGEEDEITPAVVQRSSQPKLKITLKLPHNAASSAGTATPDEVEMDFAAFKRTPKRRAKAKVIHDNDIESEDPTSPEESEEEVSNSGGPTRTAVAPAGAKRPLTTRQAVLASMVDPTHVSLNESSKSKKQPLNETELALRREETARKRKNLSEKRLEDEKAQTINRLLKKQSRPRNKRVNTNDSPLPMSGARTPKTKLKANEDGEEGEEEGEEEEEEDPMDVVEYQEQVKPTMYRWVSSYRESTPQTDSTEKKVELVVSFSVPESVIPAPQVLEGTALDATTKMEVDGGSVQPTANTVPAVISDSQTDKVRAARGPGICAVAGCGQPRKYRSVKDWTIGACGIEHLKAVAV